MRPIQSSAVEEVLTDHQLVEIRPPRKRALCLAYTFMMLSWAFDFKSEGAGQGLAIQSLFIGAYLLSSMAFFLIVRFRLRSISMGLFVAFTLNFSVVSYISATFLSNDTYAIVRNAVTICIYLISGTAGYLFITEMYNNARLARHILAICSLIYMVGTVVIVSSSKGGVDLSTIRYQIIGGSVVLGASYAILPLRFRISIFEAVTAIFTISIISLSVTRTWIVVLGVQLAILMAFAITLNAKIVFRLTVVLVGLLVTVGCLQLSGVPVLDRWTERLFISDKFSVDPTAITRQRQIDSMFSSIQEHPLFGAGLDGKSDFWLERSLGGGGIVDTASGFGHNQHISMLFVGGILGAGPLLCLQLWQAFTAVGFMIKTRKRRDDIDLVFCGILGGLVVIGTLVYGMLGGTFESRGLTIWYATGTGLLVGVRDIFKRRRAVAPVILS